MTTSDLTYYQRIYDGVQFRLALARANRDRAILAALTEGHTHTQIAEATGLTRGRIGQIANRKDKP